MGWNCTLYRSHPKQEQSWGNMPAFRILLSLALFNRMSESPGTGPRSTATCAWRSSRHDHVAILDCTFNDIARLLSHGNRTSIRMQFVSDSQARTRVLACNHDTPRLRRRPVCWVGLRPAERSREISDT